MILPGTLFINVTTLKGATTHELLYWLYCSHFTRRYGADASRIGKMRNYIVGLVGSNVEALSSLDLTQRFYDEIKDATTPDPLIEKADEVVTGALTDIKLKGHVHLKRAETDMLLGDFLDHYGQGEALRTWLRQANTEAERYAEKKGTKVKDEEATEEPTGEVDVDESEDENGDEE
jgi:CRISPR-associated protein Csc2